MAAEHSAQVGNVEVLWRAAPAQTEVPVLYLHGVPTDGDDWLPFLDLTGGVAPDLPGFGRSDKPQHFDYSIDGYAAFLAAFLAVAGIDRFSLVVHDWGAVGLALAQRMPERVARLVVIDAVPLLPGYRWHRFARIWRTPLAGELAMGFTYKPALRRALREAFATEPPADFVDRAYSRFDHGTQRAILKLYRSAPPARLAAAGEGLSAIDAPTLIVWGDEDPYLATDFARLYGERLGGETTVEILERAGHWPWLDRPELVARVAGFLLES